MEKQPSRTEFSRQPARALLVDFTPPFSAGLCSNIYQALEEVFAIVCTLPGPCRVPFFSLYSLGVHHERLFPLQPMRSSFSRLCNALKELKTYHTSGLGNMPSNPNSFLAQALKEMNSEFKRQTPHIRQAMGFPAQLEVTILTGQQPNKLSKQLEQITTEMDLDTIRKIQVVSIAGAESSSQFQTALQPDEVVGESPRAPTSQSNASTDDPFALGLLDIICLQSDFLSLQDFFKGWLHDCGTDIEHMHLLLPTKDGNGEWMNLKCDIHERILDPSSLPFQSQFSLQHSGTVLRKPPSNAVPVIKLRAIQLVKADGICDSIIFGMPLLTKPTSCWKLDWEELEFHQQHFHALCHLLQKENLVLVARLASNNILGQAGPKNSHGTSPPKGHFILMPSNSLSLLVKPIACNELMLPGLTADFQSREDNPQSEYLNDMQSSLQQLQVTDVYNPLLIHSGLNKSLHGILVKSNIGSDNKTAGRKRAVNTQAPRGRGRGGRRPSAAANKLQVQVQPLMHQNTGPATAKRFKPLFTTAPTTSSFPFGEE